MQKLDKEKVVLLMLLLGLISQVSAQYKPIDKGSSVGFKVKHFGIETGGSFTGLEGTINFDPNQLANSSINVSIDANSINTENELRDNHLRGETYFDIKNYPRIRFTSTRIVTEAGKLVISGKLTIKNHSQDISFPFDANTTSKGFLFAGKIIINRKDFDIGGSGVISNTVEVQLNIFVEQ